MESYNCNNLHKEEIIRILNDYYLKNIQSRIDEKTKTALKGYTTNTSSLMASILLNRKEFTEDGKRILMGDMSLIRNLILTTKLPIPLTVYHGTSIDLLKNYPLESGFYQIKTLMSTSLNIDVAIEFLGHYRGEGLVLQVDLPKGYPALWINPLSKHKTENELILTDNIKFDILGYEEIQKSKFLKYVKVYSKPHDNISF